MIEFFRGGIECPAMAGSLPPQLCLLCLRDLTLCLLQDIVLAEHRGHGLRCKRRPSIPRKAEHSYLSTEGSISWKLLQRWKRKSRALSNGAFLIFPHGLDQLLRPYSLPHSFRIINLLQFIPLTSRTGKPLCGQTLPHRLYQTLRVMHTVQ